jgi:hypothetical protein
MDAMKADFLGPCNLDKEKAAALSRSGFLF